MDAPLCCRWEEASNWTGQSAIHPFCPVIFLYKVPSGGPTISRRQRSIVCESGGDVETDNLAGTVLGRGFHLLPSSSSSSLVSGHLVLHRRWPLPESLLDLSMRRRSTVYRNKDDILRRFAPAKFSKIRAHRFATRAIGYKWEASGEPCRRYGCKHQDLVFFLLLAYSFCVSYIGVTIL